MLEVIFFVSTTPVSKGFCLRTRSHVLDIKHGKNGDLKFIEGETYEYYPNKYFNPNYEKMITCDMANYKDPYMLYNPQYQGGYVFGFHPKPERVRYALNSVGEKERLLFVNGYSQKVKKKDLVVGVYRYVREVYGVSQQVTSVQFGGVESPQ